MEIDDKIYLNFIFSLVLSFNHDVFIYNIASIGTSNAAADDVTNICRT